MGVKASYVLSFMLFLAFGGHILQNYKSKIQACRKTDQPAMCISSTL